MKMPIAWMPHRRALKVGRLRLFFYEDAVKLIEACRSRRVRLLGLDSFQVSARGIRPCLEYSYDYSGLDLAETWDRADQDLSKLKDSDFVFEVVF